MSLSAKIEWHTPTGHGAKKLLASPEVIEDAITKIEKDWSTTIELISDKWQVMISASCGSYAVFASTGDDEFFDLLGDPGAKGSIEFVHGGQPAPHPRRHLVSKELALEVAAVFFEMPNDPLRAGGLRWEKQGAKEVTF